MPYPIITPEFFKELTDGNVLENKDIVYNVLTTPASIEYVFPLNQERVIRRLMETKGPLAYRMTTLKPEQEAEYAKRGEELMNSHPFLKYYWPLKTLTMNVLQNRNYTIEQRMLILNFAYKSSQTMFDKFKEEVIPAFVNDFTSSPNHDDVIQYFSAMKPNYAFSYSDGISLIKAMPRTEEWEQICFTIFKNVGMDINSNELVYDDDKYSLMKKAYYEDFLKGREHYIENVMVNYVWTFCMPYADYQNASLWENFVFFNTIFNAIKVMLTCYTYGRNDKDEAFVTAVKAFDDSFRHIDGNAVRRLVDVNIERNMANNGDMAILSIS